MVVRDRTMAAIESAGYAVDSDLWPDSAATCDPDKCGSIGQDGNENTETQVPPPGGH